MNHCETCSFRTEDGRCNSRKLIEDRPSLGFTGITEDEKRSLLIYPFSGKDTPWVGEKFGCIHHEAVDVTIAVNRLLKEIDKLHALSMQVLGEVKKARGELGARAPRSEYEAAIKAQREVTKWQRAVRAAYRKWKGDE